MPPKINQILPQKSIKFCPPFLISATTFGGKNCISFGATNSVPFLITICAPENVLKNAPQNIAALQKKVFAFADFCIP